MRAGEPTLRITKALRLRQRFVGRLLHEHLANLPPGVAKHILDFIMNDLGKLSVSMRWACILLRSGVQLEFCSSHRFIAPSVHFARVPLPAACDRYIFSCRR